MTRRGRTAAAWQVGRLAPLLYALARELRAGATVHTAVRAVAADPTVAGAGLVELARRVDDGAPALPELERWAADLEHPDADLVRAVLALGLTTGGALAATLERAADRIADRVDLQREIRALSGQARASALLLTVAPVGFLALLAMVDRGVLSAATTEPVAIVAILVGMVLNVGGWVWMRRLAERVAR